MSGWCYVCDGHMVGEHVHSARPAPGRVFTVAEVQSAFRLVHQSIEGSSASPAEALCEVEMALGLSNEECEAIHG